MWTNFLQTKIVRSERNIRNICSDGTGKIRIYAIVRRTKFVYMSGIVQCLDLGFTSVEQWNVIIGIHRSHGNNENTCDSLFDVVAFDFRFQIQLRLNQSQKSSRTQVQRQFDPKRKCSDRNEKYKIKFKASCKAIYFILFLGEEENRGDCGHRSII